MSATPQPGCVHRKSLPSRTAVCVTPFPCKRRVVLWGLDSQEWLRVSAFTPPQRLHCEYTDKQPTHSAGEETRGAEESALSAETIGDDHGELHSTDHERDAHPQMGTPPSEGLEEQFTVQEQEREELARAHSSEGSSHGLDIYQDSTSSNEGQHVNAIHGDVDSKITESVAPVEDDGASSAQYELENIDFTESEIDDDSERAESEQQGSEIPATDRPEDRVPELQGTKIAAAPDLMGSRPAMLSAPLEALTESEDLRADAADSSQSLVSTADVDVSTAAADLPAIPEALKSPESSASGTQNLDDEPDGRSLNTLLPLKPGGQKGKGSEVAVTATRTPDGTMFSFESKKKSAKGHRKGKPAQTQSSTAGLSTSSIDSVMSVESVQSTNLGGATREAQVKGQSTLQLRSPSKPTSSHDAAPGTRQRGDMYGAVASSGLSLDGVAASTDFDEGEFSGEEEFMLIQMEADDSMDAGMPETGPSQQTVDDRPPAVAAAGPTSPFTPSAPEAFFKDVDVESKPADKRGYQEVSSSPGPANETRLPPSAFDEPPQTIRHVENAKDSTSAPPKPPRTPEHGEGVASDATIDNARETGSTTSSDPGISASRGRFIAMTRGAGSSRAGPGTFGAADSGAGLQAPTDAMSPDSNAGVHSTDPAAPRAVLSEISATSTDAAAAADPAKHTTAATDSAQPSTTQTPAGQAPLRQSTPETPSFNASSGSNALLKASDGNVPAPSAAESTVQSGPFQDVADVQSTAHSRQSGALQPNEGLIALNHTDVKSDKLPAAHEGAAGISNSNKQVPKEHQSIPNAQAEDLAESIRSHPLDDVAGGVPGAVDNESTVALVRQREEAVGDGNVSGRGDRAAADDGSTQSSAAVDGNEDAGPQSAPAATPSQSDGSGSLPTAEIPQMPPAVRRSRNPDLPRPNHDPPTDAASAFAIAALAGAAAGIPPSGLARGFRSRRQRRARGGGNTGNGVLSPAPSAALVAPDVRHSSDIFVSMDPDDAGKDFTPPIVSSPPPTPTSPSTGSLSNDAEAISEPEPQLSGPPLEDPPEGLIHPFHLTLFAVLLFGAVVFAITVIHFTTDIGWLWSAVKVFRKLAKSLAFRQSIALMVAIAFVRYGLEPLVRCVRSVFSLPGPWERSTEYFILKQVYQPLEFLLFVAAISTVVEAVLPPLVAVQKETVRIVVRTMLSLTYVIASAFVVFNIKARIVQEKRWRAELSASSVHGLPGVARHNWESDFALKQHCDTAAQRSIEATNKLLTVLFLFVATLLGLQAIGLDIQSVLAISGFGGLALGLAGREILENVFNGLLIVSSRSFVVGEEIMFTQSGHAGRIIEGIIMDIGWYRTLIRSFEREVYIVPNSVFSRTVVLNVTRKGKEWRVFENIGVRVEDISAVPSIIGDMRRIIRNDVRVLPKLHRRVFLDKVNRNELTIYISFYIEAANRDAFMATKQEIFLEFALACERHGAQLASNRHQVQLVPNLQNSGAASLRLLSDASLDPDISNEGSGFDEEELSSGSSGTDVDEENPSLYRGR